MKKSSEKNYFFFKKSGKIFFGHQKYFLLVLRFKEISLQPELSSPLVSETREGVSSALRTRRTDGWTDENSRVLYIGFRIIKICNYNAIAKVVFNIVSFVV